MQELNLPNARLLTRKNHLVPSHSSLQTQSNPFYGNTSSPTIIDALHNAVDHAAGKHKIFNNTRSGVDKYQYPKTGS